MIINIIKSRGWMLVAVCDDAILGKIFEEKGAILDLSVGFYQGKKVSDDHVKEIMASSDNLNIVGEKSIALAIELGLIDKDHVRRIAKIPYAQVAINRE